MIALETISWLMLMLLEFHEPQHDCSQGARGATAPGLSWCLGFGRTICLEHVRSTLQQYYPIMFQVECRLTGQHSATRLALQHWQML